MICTGLGFGVKGMRGEFTIAGAGERREVGKEVVLLRR